MSTPAARLSVVEAVPSPQLMTTVCVSLGPGSANLPASVTEPPTFGETGEGLTCRQVGGTFFTETLVEPLAVAPPLSVTVTPMLSIAGADDVDVSSRNSWLELKAVTPEARLIVVLGVPSPQLTITVC